MSWHRFVLAPSEGRIPEPLHLATLRDSTRQKFVQGNAIVSLGRERGALQLQTQLCVEIQDTEFTVHMKREPGFPSDFGSPILICSDNPSPTSLNILGHNTRDPWYISENIQTDHADEYSKLMGRSG